MSRSLQNATWDGSNGLRDGSSAYCRFSKALTRSVLPDSAADPSLPDLDAGAPEASMSGSWNQRLQTREIRGVQLNDHFLTDGFKRLRHAYAFESYGLDVLAPFFIKRLVQLFNAADVWEIPLIKL